MTDQQAAFIGVNSSTLVIGATGSGKSALLATAYEYVWEEHGMISLHYASDPGGFPDKLRALMAVGIVRVWQMQSRGIDFSFETADLASKGYWPAIIDPRTGISPIGVQMIPPVVTLYSEYCGNCKQLCAQSIAEATLAQGLCPHCHTVRNRMTARITQTQSIAKGFEQVGARGYDGLTSLSDWYLQDLSLRKDLGGEEGALGGKVQSGNMVFRQNNRSQVGFAQQRAHSLIVNSLSIPGMVIRPLWTAIANETSDQGGLTVIGPKLAGDAKTEIATSWFGNVFEAAVEENEQGLKIRRLYLNEYISNGKRHLCKQRSDSRFVADRVEDRPYDANGRPTAQFEGFNLGLVLRSQDDSLRKTIEEVQTKYPNAPGLDNVPSSYGYDVQGAAEQPAGGPVGGVAAGAAAPVARPAPSPRAPAPRARKTAGTVAANPAQAAAVASAEAQPAAAVADSPALPMEQPPTTEGAPLATMPPTESTATVPLAAAAPTPAAVPAAPAAAAEARPADQTPVVASAPAAPAQEKDGVAEARLAAQPQAAPADPVKAAPAVPAATPWAPPPGGRLAAPRAPAPAPRARPVARPPVK